MKQLFKSFLCVILISSVTTSMPMDLEFLVLRDESFDVYGRPFFLPRSQGDNLARRMVGEEEYINFCTPLLHGTLSLAIEGGRSFVPRHLGRYFSLHATTDATSTMNIQGSLSPAYNVATTDVQAENFLLSSYFNSTIQLLPILEFVVGDVNLRLNFDNWVYGTYMNIELPVQWVQTSMRLTETIISYGLDIVTPDGIITNPAQPPFKARAPFNSMTAAWTGDFDGTLIFENENSPAQNRPITIHAMTKAKINGKQSKTGLTTVNLVFGYNFVCEHFYHLGVNFRLGAPTGNRPNGEFVFEPIVGDGRHWKVGGGLTGHARVWESKTDPASFSIWFEGAAYHMFKTKQMRTFDLKENGVGSRYLLLKKFNDALDFTGELVRGPNITTVEATSSFKITGEANVMVEYRMKSAAFDAGYCLWGRNQENLTITGRITDKVGILGGAPLANSNANPALPSTYNNQTNSTAHINGADSDVFGDGPVPVLLTNNDLNTASAIVLSQLTHKFFTNLRFAKEFDRVTPFIGFGGEFEFSGRYNQAMSLWGVWIKGGCTF